MRTAGFRALSLAVTTVVVVSLTFVTGSLAQEQRGQSKSAELERFTDVLEAQALYEQVLLLGKGGPHTGPYTAPLHDDKHGRDSYLWGGLDPIALIARYNKDIQADPGGVVFISRSGSDLGDPSISLPVSISIGGTPTTFTALFKTDVNRTKYLQMMSEGSLMVMFGLNCQWGIISGPANDFARRASHWAQPGLASIAVERFFDGRVTVLGVNLYSRGDDWNATAEKRWKFAIEAFERLLELDEQWDREREEMPVIKVN